MSYDKYEKWKSSGCSYVFRTDFELLTIPWDKLKAWNVRNANNNIHFYTFSKK